MTIDTNAITMTSADSTRIYLPCQITHELSMEALNAVWANGKDVEDIADLKAYLVPHVSRTRPTIGYIVEITTNDGQHITKRIYKPAATEAAAVLASFFEAGAPGLDEDCRQCLERQHKEYYGRCAA